MNQNSINQSTFFDISSHLNPHDLVTMNFLIQTAIAEAKGYTILSDNELQDTKARLQLLLSRQGDLTHKLNMEIKLKDAAVHLSKYSTSTNTNTHDSAEDQQGQKGKSNRKSILGFSTSSSKRRLSKHALEEATVATQKIETLQAELNDVSKQITDTEMVLQKHSTAILALTHQGSGTEASRIYSKALEYDSNTKNINNSLNNNTENISETKDSKNEYKNSLDPTNNQQQQQRSWDSGFQDVMHDQFIENLSSQIQHSLDLMRCKYDVNSEENPQSKLQSLVDQLLETFKKNNNTDDNKSNSSPETQRNISEDNSKNPDEKSPTQDTVDRERKIEELELALSRKEYQIKVMEEKLLSCNNFNYTDQLMSLKILRKQFQLENSPSKMEHV